MKRFFCILLLLSGVAFAADTYFDVGAGTLPLHPKKKSTYMAVGKRFEIYRGSVDLSASHQITSSFQNYVGIKGMVTQDLGNNFYIGAGPGLGTLIEKSPKWGTAQIATFEGVIGYRLPDAGRIKPHFQLGVTQPLHIIRNGTGHKLSRSPAATLSLKLRY